MIHIEEKKLGLGIFKTCFFGYFDHAGQFTLTNLTNCKLTIDFALTLKSNHRRTQRAPWDGSHYDFIWFLTWKTSSCNAWPLTLDWDSSLFLWRSLCSWSFVPRLDTKVRQAKRFISRRKIKTGWNEKRKARRKEIERSTGAMQQCYHIRNSICGDASLITYCYPSNDNVAAVFHL